MWRALLLLGGPLVHATVYGAISENPAPILKLIELASYLFRMAAFFAIAGFLASLHQAKERWLNDRVRQLLVPMCTVFLLMSAVRYYLFAVGMSRQPPWSLNPEHLWFLISLMFMSVSMYFFERTAMSRAIMRWSEQCGAFLVGALALTVVVNVLCILALWFWLGHIHRLDGVAILLLLRILPQMCFYMLGFYVARSKACTDFLRVTRWWPVPILFWISGMLLFSHYDPSVMTPPHGPYLEEMPRIAALAFASITQFMMCLMILASALRIGSVPRWVGRMSGSAYSIYLLHVPFVMLLAAIAADFFPDAGVYRVYGVLAVGSFVASYVTHIVFIERSPYLSFLLNGKKLPPSVSVGRRTATTAV